MNLSPEAEAAYNSLSPEEKLRADTIIAYKLSVEATPKGASLIQLSFNAGALELAHKLSELNPLFRMALVEVIPGIRMEYDKVELELYELLKSNPST